MTRSLQSRLLLGTGIVVALCLLIAGSAVYYFSRAALYAEFDETLRAKVQALAALTEDGSEGIELGFREFGFEEFVRAERPAYFQVWLDDGVLARSEHLVSGDLPRDAGSLVQPEYRFMRLPDGRRGRRAGVTFHPRIDLEGYQAQADRDDDDIWNENEGDDEAEHRFPLLPEAQPGPETGATFDSPRGGLEADEAGSGHAHIANGGGAAPQTSGVMTIMWQRSEPTITIVVARETTAIDDRLASLRWILGSVGVTVTTMCLGMLGIVVRRGLSPIRTISHAIHNIDAQSLHDRVSTDGAPTEVAPIVERLNELLARLEQAFDRERGFSADIAHEMRTPLSGLRSTIEVYLSRPHDNEEYREALQTCLTICDQSQEMVENLLALARLENRQEIQSKQTVRVDNLLHDCWTSISDHISAKDLQVSWSVADSLEAKSDQEKLRVVLRNIIGNAVSHSDRGGSVDIFAAATNGLLEIQVKNSGNRLSGDQARHVFDRLWRGDAARAETGEHFGLGLTLTKRLTESLGGDIHANVERDIFSISLSLPLDAAAHRVAHPP